MMKTKMFTVNPFNMNCYIYYDENSKEAVIFDPGVSSVEEEKLIKDFVEENNLKVKYIVNTHGHLDHILGNKFAKDFFKTPIYMHKDDLFLIENAAEQARFFGLDFPKPPDIDFFIDESSEFQIGDSKLQVIHTPGHSPGSVCLIDHNNKNIFCGDLIFKNSIGRYDLPGGDYYILIDSIKKKLFPNVKNDYTLYPGHMEITNVKDEKKSNPFLK